MSRNGRRRRARLGIARMITRLQLLEKLGQAAKYSLRQRLWESMAVFLRGLAGARLESSKDQPERLGCLPHGAIFVQGKTKRRAHVTIMHSIFRWPGRPGLGDFRPKIAKR